MDTTETIVAIGLYWASVIITPGPNNLLLAASGVEYGFRRTLLGFTGVVAGMVSLLLLAGFMGEVLLQAAPNLEDALRIAGIIYLLYLSWCIAFAGPPQAGRATQLGFWRMLAFQFVNPKALAISLSAQAAFRLPELGDFGGVAAVTGLYLLCGAPCMLAWVLFGQIIGRWLQSDRHHRLFNGAMGLATAASALLLLV